MGFRKSEYVEGASGVKLQLFDILHVDAVHESNGNLESDRLDDESIPVEPE